MENNDLLDEFREGIKNVCSKINKEPILRKMYYRSYCTAKEFRLIVSCYDADEENDNFDTVMYIEIIGKDKYEISIFYGRNYFDDRIFEYQQKPLNGKTYWRGTITAEEVVIVLKDMWSKGLIAMEQVRDEFTKRHIISYRKDIDYND